MNMKRRTGRMFARIESLGQMRFIALGTLVAVLASALVLLPTAASASVEDDGVVGTAVAEYSDVPWYIFLTLLGIVVAGAIVAAILRRRTYMKTLSRLAERS